MSLVVWRPPLDLAMLAVYRKVRLAADVERLKHTRLVAQVDRIIGNLAEEYCETELDLIEDLQRTLRLITKGTPLTEALTPEDKEPLLLSDPNFSQQQYDAQTQLLKVIYRKLAMRLHPDRGGDIVTWNEVDTAYKMRDVNRLNAIWFSITEGRNLYWQQSSGVYHVSSELERYRVQLVLMQQTPGWRATRLYLAGQVNTAVDIVRLYLADKIAALNNEITYISTKEFYNGQEGKRNQEVEGPCQEDRQGHQGEGESQGSEGCEIEEGNVSSGESAPGSCGGR